MVKRERSENDEFKVSADRISVLSSDLLGLILSKLTMKEAAATSILSRGWRYLWTLSPTLDLDGTEFMERVKKFARGGYGKLALESLEKERREYVRWVDRVVGCSTAERLAEFRLFFDLTKEHAANIDGWLDWAISRKVERLELNLTSRASLSFRLYRQCYDFPYRKWWNFPDGLKTMKKLLTHNVNVSGEALEFFLGTCPLLEQLSVSCSGHLTALKITRTFPSFKCLEITLCDNLESLEIRDSDLVTLKYGGPRVPNLQLLNVPLLTQLGIKGGLTLNMNRIFDKFSPLLPQLQMLEIYFYSNPSWEETAALLSGARMSNLKQLEVTVIGMNEKHPTLLPLINLLSASHCPCLQRFVVELRLDGEKYDDKHSSGRREFHTREYPHLKDIEFVGFRGDFLFHELIMHFVENDVALENLVVDPRSPQITLDHPWGRIYRPSEEEMLARAYAKEQLTKYIHPRINLNIL